MRKQKVLTLIISFILAFALLCPLCVFAEEDSEKKLVSISFDTLGGSTHEAIYGYAGETKITKDMLPTPVKDGYVFTGWHHFNQYGMPFESEVFPNYDITLVAAFKENGFSVSFEGSINKNFDYNSGIELYEPKTEDYSADILRGGWRCLRTKKTGGLAPMFLLSYRDKLEVGKEYEFTVWLKSDNELTKGSVDFVYVNNPDVRDNLLGYQKAFDINNLKKGEWCEYKVKFIAAAPYVIVRMPQNQIIMVDDIRVQLTGTVGQPPTLIEVKESPVTFTVCLIALAAVFVAYVIFDMIKNKKQC